MKNIFSVNKVDKETENNEKMLKRAYELRDYEIEMYWKRAQYFWGFIAVIFAGYFLMLGNITKVEKIEEFKFSLYLLAISSIGSIFSYSWYLVNRGSKRWQENWEHIISDLEEKLGRELYKIRPKIKVGFNEAGDFSVSKINISLSLFVTFIWITFNVYTSCLIKNNDNLCIILLINGATLMCLILTRILGKSNTPI